MMSRLKLSILLLAAALTVSACGIKPSKLTPPNGDTEKEFPGVYPYDVTGKVKNK